jgi:hypothetical protein
MGPSNDEYLPGALRGRIRPASAAIETGATWVVLV